MRSHVARACLGPSFGAKCPPQDHVVHAKPSLRPNVHKLRHVGPSSAQDAQVGPKWAPVRGQARSAKFDPSQLWLGQAGPLLSSLSYSLSAGGSRREATRIRFLKLSSLKHLFETALHAKPSLRPNVHKLRHVPKLYVS